MRQVVVPRVTHAPAMPAASARVVQMHGKTMGTTWQVKCVLAPARGGRQLLDAMQRAVQARLDRVVSQMSTWDPDSELSRFNRAPAGTRAIFSADLGRVLDYALEVARDSGGACDVAAGALVNAWGFGPGSPFSPYREPGFEPPGADAVETARALSGWRRLQWDPAGRSAVQPGGLQLDLSSIAKGFGVDQVARYLQEAGIDGFLVEVGGELCGRGIKPDGQPWWVCVEAPEPGIGMVETVVALHGLSIATSGDYRRFFESRGSRHCHAIDPRSGHPVASEVASVTVLHEACMAADALSTALMVMGPEDGIPWADRRGIAALFRIRQKSLTQRMTKRFAELLD